MASKYTNRLESFKRSLSAFAKVRERDITDDFVLSGAVQKYALTFDLAWKVMKDILIEEYGIIDFATGSPRDTLRKAKANGIIENDIWIDMLSDRNQLAHDYDGTIAQEKIQIIIDEYLPVFETLEKRLEDIVKG